MADRWNRWTRVQATLSFTERPKAETKKERERLAQRGTNRILAPSSCEKKSIVRRLQVEAAFG